MRAQPRANSKTTIRRGIQGQISQTVNLPKDDYGHLAWLARRRAGAFLPRLESDTLVAAIAKRLVGRSAATA